MRPNQQSPNHIPRLSHPGHGHPYKTHAIHANQVLFHIIHKLKHTNESRSIFYTDQKYFGMRRSINKRPQGHRDIRFQKKPKKPKKNLQRGWTSRVSDDDILRRGRRTTTLLLTNPDTRRKATNESKRDDLRFEEGRERTNERDGRRRRRWKQVERKRERERGANAFALTLKRRSLHASPCLAPTIEETPRTKESDLRFDSPSQLGTILGIHDFIRFSSFSFVFFRNPHASVAPGYFYFSSF